MLSPSSNAQVQVPEQSVAVETATEPLDNSAGPGTDRGSALREANPDALLSKPAEGASPEPQTAPNKIVDNETNSTNAPCTNQGAPQETQSTSVASVAPSPEVQAPGSDKPSSPAATSGAETVNAETQGTEAKDDEQVVDENGKRGTDQDPRVLAMMHEEARVESEIQRQEKILVGARKELKSESNAVDSLGVLDTWFGTTAAVGDQINAQSSLITSQSMQLKTLKESRAELAQLRNQMLSSEQRGKELESQGNIEQAQAEYKQAEIAANEFLDRSGLTATSSTAEYQAAQQKVSEALNAAIKNADTAYKVAKTTQTALVVTGATIATGGAAVALAGTGAVVVGAGAVAVGTAAGTGIGAISAVGEAASSVATGQKAVTEAAVDAAGQTAGYLKDSAIASVGTVIGIGVGGKIAGAAAARLKDIATPALTKVLVGVAKGASAGGANAAVSTTTAITEDFIKADSEFAKVAEGKGYTAEQRKEAYDKYLAQRGLSVEAITERYAKAISIGAVGGGTGGAVGIIQQGATTVAQKAGAAAVQITSDAAIGVGAAALEGNLTAENVITTVGQAVIGSAVANASHKVHESIQNRAAQNHADGPAPSVRPASEPSGIAASSAPSSGVEPTGSYKITDHEALRPTTSDSSLVDNGPIPFSKPSANEPQPQQQVLKMAAGAENTTIPVGPELKIAGNPGQQADRNSMPLANAGTMNGDPSSTQANSAAGSQVPATAGAPVSTTLQETMAPRSSEAEGSSVSAAKPTIPDRTPKNGEPISELFSDADKVSADTATVYRVQAPRGQPVKVQMEPGGPVIGRPQARITPAGVTCKGKALCVGDEEFVRFYLDKKPGCEVVGLKLPRVIYDELMNPDTWQRFGDKLRSGSAQRVDPTSPGTALQLPPDIVRRIDELIRAGAAEVIYRNKV